MPLAFKEPPELQLGPSDVVVLSGGGRGITSHLARALAPYGPRLALLGRTVIEEKIATGQPDSGELEKIGSHVHSSRKEAGRSAEEEEVILTLRDLHALGVEASYFPCDVAIGSDVANAMGRILKRYGRIDGIIHGAGFQGRHSYGAFAGGLLAGGPHKASWSMAPVSRRGKERTAIHRVPLIDGGPAGKYRPGELRGGQQDDVGTSSKSGGKA